MAERKGEKQEPQANLFPAVNRSRSPLRGEHHQQKARREKRKQIESI